MVSKNDPSKKGDVDKRDLNNPGEDEKSAPVHFIRHVIDDDITSDKYNGRVVTRFPPEPNGYLHIGHAKSICLNFGLGLEYGGKCHLRFDDTNPEKEETEYVDSIKADVKWLGFNWGNDLYYTSDYFDRLYEYALELIRRGKAYVDSLSAEQIREYRGTLTEPGRKSPYRSRGVEENLALFEQMRDGGFSEGQCVLRAKIDMASPNMVMRDPALYRIRKKNHHRTGDKWCIYPMYDFAHCLSDSIEGITHSLCTLEFTNNRELYDWILDTLAIYHPQQIEFARLNITRTILSKRKLISLVSEKIVDGWDDPRMPTISGLKRRGYTPEAIRDFCERIGVAKRDSIVDIALLEHCLRQNLNRRSPRVMGVLHPLKVVIENYPEGKTEYLDAINNPEDPSMGKRSVPFSRQLYIEQDDFMEDAPKKFFRLAPGREVRLRYAYFITCREAVKNERGEIIELRCTYDPKTRGGDAPDGRKVKGTLHWVSAAHALEATVRLYDHLFSVDDPAASADELTSLINPRSMETLDGCMLEPSLAAATPGARFQFERLGYFCADSRLCLPGKPVFNRTATLRDTWARIQKKKGKAG
ncbi:MAG: glutamine--tRNA ligase/YqeY domain fusion protein [Deltaproteobacteria bacterium]|nr:glutamine--tRNA ligase/YqeY domain fusion protein [Deltaproteobacteria bacterium]